MSLSTWLIIGIITGTIGLAVFVYGKRQNKIIPMLDGFILMVYPYFVNDLFLVIIIGIVLVILPFMSALDF